MAKSPNPVKGILTNVMPNAGDSWIGMDTTSGYKVVLMKTYELSDYADDVVGSDNAEAIFAYAGNDIVQAGGGNDMVSGGDGNDQIDGGKGDDSLYGGNGNDTILGGAGNDWIDGGAGADLMDGGSGNDTYVVDSASDKVVEYAGSGIDTVRTTLGIYSLSANVENLTYAGSPAQSFTGYGNELNNQLTGGQGIDVLYGQEGDDKLYGNGANDTLVGGDGDDRINGGAGADNMVGGAGYDEYWVDNLADIVDETGGSGIDRVWVSGISAWAAGNGVEHITFSGSTNFSALGNSLANVLTSDSGNDSLQGDAGDDKLIGGDGNDKLDGGTGADNMLGGNGDDTYYVDSTLDTVYEELGGFDSVMTALATYTLGDKVEALGFTSSANHTGHGNVHDNQLTGHNGNDTLYGYDGNDKLSGGNGNDVLVGGNGADTLSGGFGADKFVMNVVSASDTIKDFEKNSDKIDLSSFDAVAGIAGDQAFIFLGKGSFIGEGEGSVRYTNETSSSCRVFVDVNGDAKSDFDFLVAASGGTALTLTTSDFML